MSEEEVPVLVVGGSLVGLTTSVPAVAAGIPLKTHRIAPDGDLANPNGRFEKTVGVGAQGALLLRPDGVVGWRTRGPHADPRARLDEVMRRLTFAAE